MSAATQAMWFAERKAREAALKKDCSKLNLLFFAYASRVDFAPEIRDRKRIGAGRLFKTEVQIFPQPARN